MTIGRKRTTRRMPARQSAPGDLALDAVSSEALEIDPDSPAVDLELSDDTALSPDSAVSTDSALSPDAAIPDDPDAPIVDPEAPNESVDGSDAAEEETAAAAESTGLPGLNGETAYPAVSAESHDPILGAPIAGADIPSDSGSDRGSEAPVSSIVEPPNTEPVTERAAVGEKSQPENNEERPTGSLLARWKTPTWAASAGATAPPDSTRDALEIDSIPALLRLPPRQSMDVADAGPADSSALHTPAANAGAVHERAVDTDLFENAPRAEGTGSTPGRSTERSSIFNDWRAPDAPSGAPAVSSTDLNDTGGDEAAAPALTFHFRAKGVTAPTPEEAAAQQDWAAPRTARIGNRSELPRGAQGRQPGRPGPASASERDDVGRPGAPPREMMAGGEEFAEAETDEAVSVDAGAGVDTGASVEDAEGRDDRAGRRRRKDRRGRRPERNGARDATDDDVLDVEGAPLGRLVGEAPPVRPPEPEPVPTVQLQDEEQVAEMETLSRISLDQRLGKELFVNTGARETRIAYVVAGALTELHLERDERLVGAICKARVDRVLPGMDAAFVDAGLERNAFLQAGDVVAEDDDDDQPGGRRPSRHQSIADLLKPRQEIMVQVTKAPHSTKGARVSTRISLPGRFLVLMPDTETVGVSRKIDDDDERDRLKKIARSIRPSGFGVIVRTEAENKTEEELRSDVEFLVRLWGQIQQKYRSARAGTIVHRDLSLTFKVVRDLFGSDVNRFVIDSRDEYEKVMELVDFITPKMKSRVLLYEDPVPLFERIGIEDEIERLFRNKVWLKSGGTLLLDETEALTTIDVNTGKYVGTTNLSQTIFKINMEAVAEICRQLRLRDIGGMIILDFIDMSNARDRAAVMKALEVNLKKDRSRTKIAHLSPLGLVEMTRKRTGETFRELTTEPCDYCGGRGRTMNPDTVSIRVEREIKKLSQEYDDEAFLVMVHPAVAPFLLGPEGVNTDRLEREIRRGVYVRSTDNLHIEKFEVAPVDMQEVERQLLPYREGQVVDCIVEQSAAFNLPHAVARMDGYLLDLVNGGQYLGRRVRARLTRVGRSMAIAEVVGSGRSVDKLGGS